MVTDEEIREVLEEVDRKAAEHNEEYAAGMRNARSIIETGLLG